MIDLYKDIKSYQEDIYSALTNEIGRYKKQLEKEKQTKSKVSRRKEIINIRAEVNGIEMKKTIEK